ncbi:MAG TPA: adenylyltransferase/cytidyltransferase family protein, partial [bacterium]|nr:adenylyltransferase/cytidyltransferase family protein [bacterium]
MKIGLLGGTFDPIHIGHLIIAERMREALALDRVIFIPAGRPPHRPVPAASAPERLEMVRLAIAGNEAFTFSEIEL